MELLSSIITKDIKEYLDAILTIINDDELNLPQKIKESNKNSLNSLYDYFQKIKTDIKKNFIDYLNVNQLKINYKETAREIYEQKSDNYKQNMDYKKCNKKI